MLLKRLSNSAVVWSYIHSGFYLASGIIILPLVLRLLSDADLGMYYVLMSQLALGPIIDFGFAPTINRFVGYAMGGAKTLAAHGVPKPEEHAGPNYPLLWELLHATQKLYRYLTLAVLVILGAWGTFNVELRIHETSSVLITRIAWGVTLVSTVLDIYFNWWINFLRGMNQVRSAAQFGLVGSAIKMGIAAALLLAGGGLLSLPVATLISALVQRFLVRRRCLALLKTRPSEKTLPFKEIFAALWPNTWRTGVQLLSSYLTIHTNTTICTYYFGLAANGQYRLSVQLLNIAVNMSYVWLLTKWPLISQYQARHEHALIRHALWPRYWLLNLSFLLMASGVVGCGPYLLRWIGGGKEMLPPSWMLLLMLWSFFELQFTSWCNLILTSNRLPFLWPSVATNVGSLLLTLALVHFGRDSLGLGALVLGPLLAGSVFNYWYWPPYAARSIGTSLLQFLFNPRRLGATQTNG